MNSVSQAIYNLRIIDELAERKSVIHNLHPLSKLLSTLVFTIIVVSFGKYEIERLIPLLAFPVILLLLADIPVKPLFKRLLIASPIILGIGIFNPIFDNDPQTFLGIVLITGGWISFISLILKFILTIMSVLILISTTGMIQITEALESLKIPRLLAVQILLTYRYIYILVYELLQTLRAYSQRSGQYKGIKIKAAGPLIGGLLIRTHDRAHNVYLAMCQRGFNGDIHSGYEKRFIFKDLLFMLLWSIFFIFVRYFDLPGFFGSFIS